MKKILIIFLISTLPVIFTGCTGNSGKSKINNSGSLKVMVMKQDFGIIDGKKIFLFSLQNKNGVTVKITNYGGIITHLFTPDKNGKPGDIVLGYDSVGGYLKATPYFGAIVGRYANRIAHGEFGLDGKTYHLAKNNGNNSLHGGIKGFDKVIWDAKEISDSAGAEVVLSYLSRDGEEGYPGNLSVTVTYTLNEQDEFRVLIEAVSDKPTPVNLCNHSYFNLRKADTSVLGHILTLNASLYTVVNDELIPTGELKPVAGTPMDFTKPEVVGKRIDRVIGGYDHNYVLLKKPGELSLEAKLEDPVSGRILEVYTTQPGIQFYSGNFLDGSITGKNGKVYKQHWGLCLETQHFPDSPNQPSFPNSILRPGEKYRELTVYKFLVKETK
jgi:aldose 1-epimerase